MSTCSDRRRAGMPAVVLVRRSGEIVAVGGFERLMGLPAPTTVGALFSLVDDVLRRGACDGTTKLDVAVIPAALGAFVLFFEAVDADRGSAGADGDLADRLHAGPVQVLVAVLLRLDILRRTLHETEARTLRAATEDLRACLREIERSTNVVTERRAW